MVANSLLSPIMNSRDIMSDTALTTEATRQPALKEAILDFAHEQPEHYLLTWDRLGHLGIKREILSALKDLQATEDVYCLFDDVYVAAINSRFGKCIPADYFAVVQDFAGLRGEIAVTGSAAAANMLRMCDQLSRYPVFFTSGDTKELDLGGIKIVLRHADSWKLLFGETVSGLAIRAMDCDGPDFALESALHIRETITSKEWHNLMADIESHADIIPTWVSEALEEANRT